eukprot:TRINITY_DN480_c0_g2_i1.p1 TRINITY_DN480_c0_g2~~TRINITY_DN480_c0_g2_i1.p1  ORF type:complete len:262 (-),score=55.08 TRINITY_DN480_c0_g2_i1:547-1332(-)
MLSKVSPHFSFKASRFGIQTSKARTARVSLFKEFADVPAVYTLETSFADTHSGLWLTPNLLKSIGRDIGRALIPYCGLSVPFPIRPLPKRASQGKPKETAARWKEKTIKELRENSDLINQGIEDSDVCSGSDSNPSDDDLPEQVLQKVLAGEIDQRSIAVTIAELCLQREERKRSKSIGATQREGLKKKRSFGSNIRKSKVQVRNIARDCVLQSGSRVQIASKPNIRTKPINTAKKSVALIPVIAQTIDKDVERDRSYVGL